MIRQAGNHFCSFHKSMYFKILLEKDISDFVGAGREVLGNRSHTYS